LQLVCLYCTRSAPTSEFQAVEFMGVAGATIVREPDKMIIGKFIPEQAPPPYISEEELRRWGGGSHVEDQHRG